MQKQSDIVFLCLQLGHRPKESQAIANDDAPLDTHMSYTVSFPL